MKKSVLIAVAAILCLCSAPLTALAYQYISPEEVKQGLNSNEPMTLVDIQVENEFNQHHIDGAVATYAYPVKKDQERAQLEPAITAAKTNNDKIVVVCPRGGGGAKRAYDFMLKSGLPEERLFILTKGQQGWPYADMLAAEK